MKFDFDFFKKGNVYVHIVDDIELKSFLKACKENNIVWAHGKIINPEEHKLEKLENDFNKYLICFYFDITCNGLAWKLEDSCIGYMAKWYDFMKEYPYSDKVKEEKVNTQVTQSFINIPVVSKLNGRLYNLISYVGKNEKEEIVLVEDLKDGKLFTAPLDNFRGTVGKKKNKYRGEIKSEK